MILRCIGGPMDGARYVVYNEESYPPQRKPDKLVFNRFERFPEAIYCHVHTISSAGNSGDVVLEYKYTPTVLPATCNRGYECGAKM